MNLLSCPIGYNRPTRDEEMVKEVLDALGMTASEMISFRGNPMDKMGTLVEHNIPVILIYGDNDTFVSRHSWQVIQPYASCHHYLISSNSIISSLKQSSSYRCLICIGEKNPTRDIKLVPSHGGSRLKLHGQQVDETKQIEIANTHIGFIYIEY